MSENQKSEEEIKYEQAYQKGYEAGYDLSRWLPDIAKDLVEIDSNTPYLTGLRKGNLQFAKEQNKDCLPDWLQPDRLKTAFNDKTHHPEKDKDREPEK